MNQRHRIQADSPPRQVPTLALKAGSCASALDISLNSFLALVEEGQMPKPIPIPDHTGLVLYDWESVRNAWQAIVEAAGGGKGNPFD